ncbi:dehydrogenase/reductase SDR family member on chromosome X [Sinocyclocheilus rhinocerous]|uniref:dehydrogenase/reductase SDR family member on chromosome X n=1 Tax=Sinocyclocheilus rhinocerous TaxID=307959 RepID=UPI0007BA9BC9|nr:PREDICTED: dehydrogenase/reductase SDR family member on chromosome X [Sinocyclocheilus rhinocerous]
MLVPEGRTEDGFETHFATNYLGHFLLTCLLLDSLVHSGKNGSCSRVVSVSSSAHFAADAHLQDLLSILRLSVVPPDLEGVGGCYMYGGPQQRLTMKIFRLDSICRTRSSFTNISRTEE